MPAVLPAVLPVVTLIVVCLLLAASPGLAQDRRQNTPGQFDFYVLALSWSPSFCAAAQERSSAAARQSQCAERAYAFVVHGLWPQYEAGFPEYCQVPAPRLDRATVSSMMDLMPAPRLIFHEWDRHGTCSGLAPRAYFETVRKARAVVRIPDRFLALGEAVTVTPAEVEQAFIDANPGLTPSAISVGCDNKRLKDVRVCIGRDFRFHDCGDVDRRSCRRETVEMPPVRGG
jgi:ribonuclease T2